MDISGIEDIPKTVYHFIKYALIFGISISFLVLFATSILVHDVYWIKKNPKFFVSEALVMGFLTAIPVIYISYIRGGAVKSTLQEFGLLFAKIVLIHIGFQLSGVYSALFPKSAAPGS
jgi:hypothetical protein